MINGYIITNFRCLSNYYPHSMIDKKIFTYNDRS